MTVQAGAGGQRDDAGTGGRRTSAVVVLVVLVALVALLAGAAGGWFAHAATTRDLDQRLAAAEHRLDTLIATPDGAGATQDAGASASNPPTETTTPAPTVTAAAPGAATERHPAIVTATHTDRGTRYLTLDYVEFLTGDEVGEAAAAHGDESPPPNDYYIVNDNPLLREVPVAEGITVRVVANADGTVNPEGYDLSLADWVGRITGPSADAFLATFYWLTITDGTVTAIEQQYLP